jgi:hypothetical protein
VDRATGSALEKYREQHHLGDRSDAVRHIIGRVLSEDKLL